MHFPVTTLGPGRRIGIWLQGCSIHCPGCVARDTWRTADPAERVPIDDIVRWCERFADDADGVTVSGGEPFDQAEALLDLVRAISERDALAHCDVLVYTGYSIDVARDRVGGVLVDMDAIISEPFVGARPTTLRWRGSDNQELHPLTARGVERYADHVHERIDRSELQVGVAGGEVWTIGIPRRGTLAHVRRQLGERGVELEECSWRP